MENRIKTLKYKGKRHVPLPTGPYTVGCTDVMTSYLKFGVFVRIYYPSKDSGILARYLQWPPWLPHEQYVNGYAARLGVSPRFYRFMQNILVGKLYVPAVWQGELLPTDEKYPVIVFSHGLSGWRTTYSSICLELASRGFVVAAVEHRDYSASASFYRKQVCMSAAGNHPGSSLCDLDELLNDPNGLNYCDVVEDGSHKNQSIPDVGPFTHADEWMLYLRPTKDNETLLRSRQLRRRSKECSGTLDLLEDLDKGRVVVNVLDSTFDSVMFRDQLDLKNAFFIGHSFGGATGILCLATEHRFKAGIFLDPWMFPFYHDQSCFSMISQPFLCLLVKSFQTEKDLQLSKQLPNMHNDSQFLLMKDAEHRDLCDTPFLPKCPISLSSRFGFKIEKFSALDLTTNLILEYFGNHLGKSFCDESRNIEFLKKKYLRTDEYIDKIIK